MKGFYEANFKTNKIMGWGTGFKSDIYISRVDVKNAEQANEMRNECQEVIEDYAKTLIDCDGNTGSGEESTRLGKFHKVRGFGMRGCIQNR